MVHDLSKGGADLAVRVRVPGQSPPISWSGAASRLDVRELRGEGPRDPSGVGADRLTAYGSVSAWCTASFASCMYQADKASRSASSSW